MKERLDYFQKDFSVSAYVHDVLSYRYHWHENMYEIDVILKGKAEYSINGNIYKLAENDVVLINPGQGHSSLALCDNTVAMVIRFTSSAFKKYLSPGEIHNFNVLSDAESRNNNNFARLRFYSSELLKAAYEETLQENIIIESCIKMIAATLCSDFEKTVVKDSQKKDEHFQLEMEKIMEYVDKNYAEKISLDDIASFSGYNRTYVSTLFKDTVGINFYEYLTRMRFQHAVLELSMTKKTLTEIAISNGFPDLKTFNSRFKSTFQRMPSEYRDCITPDMILPGYLKQSFHTMNTPVVSEKFKQYQSFEKL